MGSEGSVTRWFGELRVGDSIAAQRLWERFFSRLVGLARRKLGDRPKSTADEEDVALSAFASFCRNAEQGKFPELNDRDSLWRLLMVITVRKTVHLIRDENRQKRGGGQTIAGQNAGDQSLEQVLSREPDPALAAQVTEEYERLLASLADKELANVALWKMEGRTVDEIAAKLRCAPRSVKRKLQLIRSVWEKEGQA